MSNQTNRIVYTIFCQILKNFIFINNFLLTILSLREANIGIKCHIKHQIFKISGVSLLVLSSNILQKKYSAIIFTRYSIKTHYKRGSIRDIKILVHKRTTFWTFQLWLYIKNSHCHKLSDFGQIVKKLNLKFKTF